MALILNLSRYDIRSVRRVRAGLAAGGVALALAAGAQVAGSVMLSGRASSEDGREAALRQDIEIGEARLAGARDAVSTDERRAAAARIRYLNRVLEANGLSWTRLLSELERAIPARVELVEIQPDGTSGAIRLRGIASTTESLTAFTRALEGRPAFADVFLTQQSDRPDRAGSAVPGVDFQVTLVYRSGT